MYFISLDFSRRAQIITEELNKMKNIKCNEVEGAMYAFPRIFFTQKIIDEAKKRNMAPDLFYTYEGMNYNINNIQGLIMRNS